MSTQDEIRSGCLFLKESIASGPRLEPDIIDRGVATIKRLLTPPTSDEEALEKKRKAASYDDHIHSFYSKIPGIRSEHDRSNLLGDVQTELTIARKVKESPDEYFPDPEKRAAIMKGIVKYTNDLERIESKVRNYVIPAAK